VHDSLAAAERLAALGVEAEVIDLRSLRPLDVETIAGSVEKTNRLVVVEEGPRRGGWGGEVLAAITEASLGSLDDAWRVTTGELPMPYSPTLEDAFLPGVEAIVDAIAARLIWRGFCQGPALSAPLGGALCLGARAWRWARCRDRVAFSLMMRGLVSPVRWLRCRRALSRNELDRLGGCS
jgi:hypothetical protein